MPRKSVAEEFVDHRLLSRIRHFPDKGSLPLPLDMENYIKDDPPCQTKLCTDVAVQLYNSQVDSTKKIKNALGVDSQMFILDQDDPINYWHLYFKGKVGRKPCKFFAELSGERAPKEQSAEERNAGGPKELRICQMVDKAVAASVLNCDYCFGGIWHPLQGFLGCKNEQGKEDVRVHDHGAPNVAASTSSSAAAAADQGETQAAEGAPDSQPAKRTRRPNPRCQ